VKLNTHLHVVLSLRMSGAVVYRHFPIRPHGVQRGSFAFIIDKCGDRSSTVVKVLCYKSEGGWFDSSWCHWNFSLT